MNFFFYPVFLVLFQNVAAVENCEKKLSIEANMNCQDVANSCKISQEEMFLLNPYFENGDVCNETLATDTLICCSKATSDNTETAVNATTCGGCPNILKKVCGSNTKTYDNQCELEADVCWNPSEELFVQFEGDCRKRIADLICNDDCEGRYDPVCSSNGRTFGNRCFLNVFQCHNYWAATDLKVVSMGTCPKDQISLCSKQCSDQYEPVCGSDDYTYDNPCHLEIEACELHSKTPEETLKVKHEGQCLPGVYTLCHPLFRPQCIEQGPRELTTAEIENHCTQTRCSGSVNPVCGSDNRTYVNKCFLANEICSNPSLNEKHVGVC